MKIKFTLLLMCVIAVSNAQLISLQVKQEGSDERMYSYTYEYDVLGNLITENYYDGFDFDILHSITNFKYDNEGNKISREYSYFSNDGTLEFIRNIVSQASEDNCTLNQYIKGDFGVCETDADHHIKIEYIDGCENGWIDYINQYCVAYNHISKWTRHSKRRGDVIKLIDSVYITIRDYTKLRFRERSFINGRLVRDYHNMTDVIKSEIFCDYIYNEKGHKIRDTYRWYYDNKVRQERINHYEQIYKDDLLVETKNLDGSGNTYYYYDQKDRLIKSEVFRNKYGFYKQTKYYTYANKFTSNENQIKDLIVYPNPTNDYLFFNITVEDLSQIQIYNQHGVKMENVYLENNYLDISNLSNGVYFLKSKNKDKVYQKQFIKM